MNGVQEDFPRTPSPVYSQSHVSSHTGIEHNLGSLTLNDPPGSLESNKHANDCQDAYAPSKGDRSQSSESRISDVIEQFPTVSRHDSGNEGSDLKFCLVMYISYCMTLDLIEARVMHLLLQVTVEIEISICI